MSYRKKTLFVLIRRLLLLAVLAFIAMFLALFVVSINRTSRDPIKDLLPQKPDLSSESEVLRERIELEYQDIRQIVRSGGSKEQIGQQAGNLGKLYHANGFYDHAEQCYSVAAERDAGNPRWFYYLAVIRQMKGQNDSAIQLLEKMLTLSPDYWPAILKLADIDYKRNQIDKAKAGYEKCLSLTPDNLYAHMGLARIAMDASEWEIAQMHLEKAIESNPNFAGLHRMMALVHEHFGRTEQVKESLAHAMPMTWRYYEAPDPLLEELVDLCYRAQDLLIYAHKLKDRNSPQTTLMLYKRALKLGSKNPQVYHTIGDLLTDAGLPEQACECYKKLLEIAPDYSEASAFNNYGRALGMLGKEDQAIKQYIRALELDDQLVESHANLGRLLSKQGKLDEGLGHMRKATQIDPNDSRLHYLLGRTLGELGNLDEAVVSFEKALEIDPNNVTGQRSLASILLQQGDLERASRAYKKILEVSPGDADAHKNLGTVLQMQVEFDEAINHYRRALQIKPDYIEALNNLAWILATRKDIKSFDPQEAVRLASKACNLTNYQSLGLMDTLAVSYAASGQFTKAVTLTEKALESAGSSDQNDIKAQLQKRLELFKAGQPYFEDGN